ncbi:Nudix (Nucleoside diphosphate linked moiety X)-type motif 1 [Coemansia sp. RSA 2607]|nr:Nudix (Nucleoside diphosphate linked moiety X)-type motif 1 [Coemansia sp. RSA 2607]KAJ2383728.1 Nudix (Nucleoside diphosphate linked moiety X)-type motif 1 [Coemansia sp. RSA 2603]
MGGSSDKIKYFSLIVPFSSDGRQILLGRKKRGMGKGLWNGFGGKPEKGEAMSHCAFRELHEESGLHATEYECAGILYMDDTNGPSYHIPVYRATKYTGEVSESDEMEPRWFDACADALPFEEMHVEAKLWWSRLFSKEAFVARFLFEGEEVVSQDVCCVASETLEEHVGRVDAILLAGGE